jgi:glutamyl-tRNA synthetase
MTIEALKQYILSQGASQNDVTLEWDKLWALNKKVIDPIAPKHTSLIKQDMYVII